MPKKDKWLDEPGMMQAKEKMLKILMKNGDISELAARRFIDRTLKKIRKEVSKELLQEENPESADIKAVLQRVIKRIIA